MERQVRAQYTADYKAQAVSLAPRIASRNFVTDCVITDVTQSRGNG